MTSAPTSPSRLPILARELPAHPASAGTARHALQTALAGANLDGQLAEAALLVASELVANAVVHGAPPIILQVDHQPGGGLQIAVSDASPNRPSQPPHRLTDRGEMDEQGWGLPLVAALASYAVQHAERGPGKTILAALTRPPAIRGRP